MEKFNCYYLNKDVDGIIGRELSESRRSSIDIPPKIKHPINNWLLDD